MPMIEAIDVWPTEIRLSADRKTLTVQFDNGENRILSAEQLRTLSPSAEVQGHHGVGGQQVVGKHHIRIEAIEPVGNYAVRLIFDDGHDTGLYSWAFLYQLTPVKAQQQA